MILLINFQGNLLKYTSIIDACISSGVSVAAHLRMLQNFICAITFFFHNSFDTISSY